jgi:hypothetical protein
VFSELAEDNRVAAMERVLTLPADLRPQAYAGIASAWMHREPAATVEWVRKMEGGATRDSCLDAVLDSDWALDHPDDAGALLPLFTQQMGIDSKASVLTVFRNLSDADPIAAGEWAIKYLGLGHYDSLIEAELIPRAAQDSPDTLASLLTSLAKASGNLGSAERWLQWSGQFGGMKIGHAEIYERLATIEDTAIRQSALRGLVKSDSWSFDETALALYSLTASDRAAVLPALTQSAMAGLDDAGRRAKLFDYAGQMPQGEQRNAFLAELIGSLASWSGPWETVYPKDAAELLAAYPEVASTGDGNIVTNIADMWHYRSDGQTGELLTWAASLEAPDQREQAWTSIARNLVKTDAATASEWIDTLPTEDPARDGTVAAFSRAIATEDAEAALIWAQSIKTSAVRESTLYSVIDQIAWDDPAAARQAVADSSIEESTRQALLYRIDHP